MNKGYPEDTLELPLLRFGEAGLEEIVEDLEGLFYKGVKVRDDPLHQNVVRIRYSSADQQGAERWVVCKERHTKEDAEIERQAFAHLNSHGYQKLEVYATGKKVYVCHILGPEIYQLYIEINDRLNKLKSRDDRHKVNRLLSLMDAIITKQLKFLAKWQADDFKPTKEDGKEIPPSNPNLPKYYMDNFMLALKPKTGAVQRILERCLNVLNEFMPTTSPVRYIDMYSRNSGIKISGLEAGLNELLQATRVTGQTDETFINERYLFFDPHRANKIAFDLEDLFSIIDDPKANLAQEQKTHYYCKFLLLKELEGESRKPDEKRDDDKIKRIKELTERPHDISHLLTLEEIAQHLSDAPPKQEEVLLMKFYRNSRKAYLIGEEGYIPHYNRRIDSYLSRLEGACTTDKFRAMVQRAIHLFNKEGKIKSRKSFGKAFRGVTTYLRLEHPNSKRMFQYYTAGIAASTRKPVDFITDMNQIYHALRRITYYRHDLRGHLAERNKAIKDLASLVYDSMQKEGHTKIDGDEGNYSIGTIKEKPFVFCNDKPIREASEYTTHLDHLESNPAYSRFVQLLKLTYLRDYAEKREQDGLS